MAYSYIINTPGYSPNHDHFTKFDTKEEALEARHYELAVWLEDMRDSYDDGSIVIDDWEHAIWHKHDDDVIRLPLSDSEHDLGVVFEIIETEEQA